MPTPYSHQTRMPNNTMWRISKACANGISKPKRPYTPYNLFYLLERELVVQKINGPPKNISSKRLHVGMAPREEDHIKPSSRYDGIVMAPYWYDPNMKEKRKHRKTHGMVSSLVLHHSITPVVIETNSSLLYTADFIQRTDRNHIRKLGKSR